MQNTAESKKNSVYDKRRQLVQKLLEKKLGYTSPMPNEDIYPYTGKTPNPIQKVEPQIPPKTVQPVVPTEPVINDAMKKQLEEQASAYAQKQLEEQKKKKLEQDAAEFAKNQWEEIQNNPVKRILFYRRTLGI